MIAATVATVAVFLFRINWIYGTSGLIVMAGTGFFAASMYLTNRDVYGRSPDVGFPAGDAH